MDDACGGRVIPLAAARYHSVAIILHWVIALLIIGQLFGGLYMHNLPNTDPSKFDLYQLHKSFGLSVLALSIARLGWRLTHKAPPLPVAMPNWQKLAARGVHWGFYALMILTPLAGWAIVSVSPTDIPTKWFGLIPVADLPLARSHDLEELMEEAHEILAKLIIVLLFLHVGAALKHLFVDRDGVFTTMIPPRKRHWMGFAAIIAVLAAGAMFYLTRADAPASPASPGTAPQDVKDGDWIVDRSASALTFTGTEKGRAFTGAFTDFDVDIEFDPDNLEDARVRVRVNTAAASTGEPLRDSTMPGGEWFDVKAHPEAEFEARGFRRTESGYEADGMLEIKSIERPVTIAFTLDLNGDSATARGGADLVRTDYGLGEGSQWLDDEGVALEVRVDFVIVANRS